MKGLLVSFFFAFVVSSQTLPSSFLGVWVGTPEFSELGPWGVEFNFSITQTDDNQWLMRDTFPPEVGVSGFQDFYVDGDAQSMHYCGCIREFYPFSAPTSRAYYDITTNTDKELVFCLRGTDSSCDTTWTLTLKDEDTLTSVYKFPSPVKHLDVTLKRDSSSVLLSQKEKLQIQDSAHCTKEVKECLSPSEEHKAMYEKATGSIGCPYAAMKHFGGLSNKNEMKTGPPTNPTTGGAYQNCYIFNEVVQYKYSWTYNETEQAIDAMIQIPVEDETTYVAFGIAADFTALFPNAPGMNNSDIVMGWAENNCVVSLYSDKETGAPGVSDDQVITNSATSYEDGILSVSYTRPFATGHHTIVAGEYDQIIWSTGSVKMAKDGVCEDSSWNYHSNNRGRRTIVWDNGPASFDPNMAC